MFLFKKIKKLSEHKPTKWLQQLALCVTKLQEQMAGWLSHRVEKWSMGHKKLGLFLYFIFFTGFSVCIILKTLLMKKAGANTITVNRVHIPEHIGRPGDLPMKNSILLSPGQYQRILFIRKYLDSLYKSDKRAYELLMKERPHLTDSLDWLEKTYLENHKN